MRASDLVDFGKEYGVTAVRRVAKIATGAIQDDRGKQVSLDSVIHTIKTELFAAANPPPPPPPPIVVAAPVEDAPVPNPGFLAVYDETKEIR